MLLPLLLLAPSLPGPGIARAEVHPRIAVELPLWGRGDYSSSWEGLTFERSFPELPSLGLHALYDLGTVSRFGVGGWIHGDREDLYDGRAPALSAGVTGELFPPLEVARPLILGEANYGWYVGSPVLFHGPELVAGLGVEIEAGLKWRIELRHAWLWASYEEQEIEARQLGLVLGAVF